MLFIDIGVNLTNNRFNDDRDDVLAKAESVGVSTQIITGTSPEESEAAFKLTEHYPSLFSTAGCHPHDAKNFKTGDLSRLKHLLEQDKVVAVGECGLDFNRNFSPQDVQINVFKQQLELACEVQKPLFIHERDAGDTMVHLLQEYSEHLPDAVIHCFTGSRENLEQYIEMGLYIGITGWICDERRGIELANMVDLIPDNRLMLETDAPYLTPRDLTKVQKSELKGNRNEPFLLPQVAQKVAQCRRQPLEELADNCYNNAVRFFNLPMTQL
ncbi:TatD family hydrolase [Kangiella sediminilitoris]|uniref:Hydrolase, TatD family n=1 Tax=Kangiella sediminilitoris TaxID=1144748 RepID=A0A1B3B8F8_9GAMM|nr:TatD family hydrolase [Kangiella sediminilitoris]AOE49060.1 Hydrolase, TatD family [Kangiella sediminilitoris]